MISGRAPEPSAPARRADPGPPRDPARLAALDRSGLLDAQPEEAFDRLARMAARLLRAPTVAIELVDQERILLKSCVGVPQPWLFARRSPAAGDPCERVIGSGRPLVIEDLRREPALQSGETLAVWGLVAYAGVPLIAADGHSLGVLCAGDTQPRTWGVDELSVLQDLAALAASEIDRQEREGLLVAKERTVAEEAVRAARDHLSALVQASPLPTVALRPDGEVLSWNRAAETVFGWTAGEAIGRPLPCVPEEKQAEFATLRDRVLSGYPFTGFETKRQRRDGTLLDVSISTAALHDAEGRAVGLVAIYVDITGRKRAEEELRLSQEQLRQAQKMEAVGRLAGGIAHDFNNLLTAILSYSEMVLGDLAPADPIREDVEQIRQAGGRAAELTNQLLAFSRRQLLQPRTINLNTVVVGVDRMLRRLIGEDIELRTLLAPSLGHTRADAGQLEQVLLNLAVNARDAMPGGGTLTLTTTNAEVGEAVAARWGHLEPGPYVTLSVHDTGSGMSAEVRDQIFEPFFTTKGPGRGTGLGLSTAYGIVKQSGGHIYVSSEPGSGSTFTIYLPATEVSGEVGAITAPAAPVRGSAETVLLVEDEDLVRHLTREILARNGYQVIEAADGVAALRICEEYPGPIHLMVTDVVMPRLSGRELVEQIQPCRPDMRVLYLSGYSEEAIERQGQLTEGIDLLPKPFTPGVLTAKIREILDRVL
jgi:two-component system cell cycle sensor histidine kinase/response regulator CckA